MAWVLCLAAGIRGEFWRVLGQPQEAQEARKRRGAGVR